MRNGDLNVLNQLLEGCYMAISAYTDALNRVDDAYVRGRLRELKNSRFEMAEELASFIRDAGGEARRNPGLKGMMAGLVQTVRLSGRGGCKKVLRSLHLGTAMGIRSYEQARRKVDGRSRELVERHIARIRNDLEALEEAYRRLH